MFYSPSSLSAFTDMDTITVMNNDARVKLTIAKQAGATSKKIKISKSNDIGKTVFTKIYTNLSGEDLESDNVTHDLISRKDPADRIYKISIAVYDTGAIAKKDLSNPLAVFRSTWE